MNLVTIIIFVSDTVKLVLKLKEPVTLCGCSETFSTNFKSLYIRLIPSCPALPASRLPPSALNLENHSNAKFDYSLLKSQNYTREHFNTLYNGLSNSALYNLRNYLRILKSSPDMGMIEVERPYYGLVRGDILSILHCKEKRVQLKPHTDRCTEELQVEDGRYVTHGTHINQQFFNTRECPHVPEVGDIARVQTESGRNVYITQGKRIEEFDPITGNIRENPDFLFQLEKVPNLNVDFEEFHDSGIYSNTYLKDRQQYLFRLAI